MNLLENEDLAWERFDKVVTSENVVVCYDMFLKEFELFAVHDLFKVYVRLNFINHLVGFILCQICLYFSN